MFDVILESPLLLALAVSFCYFTLWFGIGYIRGRYDVLDLAWGGSFVAIALALLVWQEDMRLFVQSLVTVMVAIWGLRLMLHVQLRSSNRAAVDKRYHDINQKPSSVMLLKMFLLYFVFRAMLACVVALPIVAVFSVNNLEVVANQYVLAAGFTVWATGLMIEFFADRQLSNFLRVNKNKNKVLDTGLWQYSRHPSYFGEVLVWVGIWVVSMSANVVWWSVIGPLALQIWLLIHAVPTIEKAKRKNKAYNDYADRTSALVLLPPKKNRSA